MSRPAKQNSHGNLLHRRQRGGELVDYFKDQHGWWWDVGKFMDEYELSGSEARSVIETAGCVVRMSDRSLRRILYTYRRVLDAGMFRSDARGCPIGYARTCAIHFEEGRITEEQLRALLSARSRVIGSSKKFQKRAEDNPKEFANELLSDE